MANFEAKNTIKQGKNAKRTNGTHFTRVLGGGVLQGSAPESAPCGAQKEEHSREQSLEHSCDWSSPLQSDARKRVLFRSVATTADRAGQQPPLDAHHPWMPGNP